ncbi:MAG TPA: CHAT domain-containing protein [Pelobium sp.]|nr:CHAT domain-containing protein [Pelobium sp.]
MRKVLPLFICFTLIFCAVSAQNGDAVFQKKQAALKAKDSLAKWIDNNVNFALEQPKTRLSFLMEIRRQVWRKPKTQQENEAWLFLLINQGYYQLQNGDILASINCYENAYQFFQKHPFDLDIEEYIFKPLSNNYTRLGDYERAIYIQKRSLNLALSQKNTELATSAYCNLATSYRSKGDLKNAKKLTVAGLAIVNTNSDIYGLLLSNMADISNENKDYISANSYIQKAIEHLKNRKKNSSTTYWLLGAYTLAGDIQLNIQNYKFAKAYYQTAKKSINPLNGSKKRELAYIINQLGKISLNQKNHAEALRYYNEALTYLLPTFKLVNAKDLPNKKMLYGENKLQATLIGKAEALELLGYHQQSLQASILAFEVSELLRKEYTYNVSKEQLQAESKALAELVIEKAYNLWIATKNIAYANEILMFSEKTKSRILFDELNANQQSDATIKSSPLLQQKIKTQQLLSYYQKQQQSNPTALVLKKIADLEFQLSTLQKRLNIKNPKLATDISEILQKIPAEKQAIIFFCGGTNTYMILANRNTVTKVTKLGKTDQLIKLTNSYLDKYFYNGPSEMVNSPKGFYNASNEVYKRLFSHINISKQKLLIVKDGVLNFLPFESLITESRFTENISKWPFLIKVAEASYAFSLSSMPLAKQTKAQHTNQFTGLFLSKTGSDKREIPSVVAEYDALKKFVVGDFFKNENATIENFKDAINHSNILHISSHSYLTDSLKEPVLELYKSKFYLLELNNQQKVPDLVVLSACQTSDGAYLSGEGVLSFSRGFIAAGSRGVISSLWNVDDKSAADFMVTYYKNLQQFKTTSGMLAKTKLQWLKQKHKNQIVLLPYYWDSLIYTGQDFNVVLSKPNHKIIYFVISILIFFLAVVFFYRRKKLHIPPARS